MEGTFTQEDIINMISNYDKGGKDEQPAAEAPIPEVEQPATENVEAQQVEPVVSEQADKDANAFAQMRTQNKLFADTLQKIADATGIQYTNQDEMIAALNGDALNKIAEKKGIPVELLQRMEQLEANSRMWEAQQQQERLTNGFKNLSAKYGLDQNALMGFAQQLDADKVNLTTVDIEKEYVSRHLEDIVNARVQAAVQAALAKDAQVGAQSSKPGAPGAASSTEQSQIKSAADLISFLGSNTPGGYK